MSEKKRIKEIEELRTVMGTHPSETPKRETRYYRGCENIEVEMLSSPENPYRTIFDLATATWGNEDYQSKWEKATVDGRISVVEAALQRKTLPICLEAPTFEFVVRGASRSAFDQVARLRIGASVSSQGVRDNNRIDAGFRIPPQVYDDSKLRAEVEHLVEKIKDVYQKVLDKGQTSWQDARCVLPMGLTHNFHVYFNYLALQDFMRRRLMECEQYDTVAIAWQMRAAVENKFALLASYLRPGCDFAQKCTYHEAYSLSEAFGCLFAGCGRWKDPYPYATFPFSSTDRKDLQKAGIRYIYPDKWEDIHKIALVRDRHYFEL